MRRLRRSTELQGNRDRYRAEPKDGPDELGNQTSPAIAEIATTISLIISNTVT